MIPIASPLIGEEEKAAVLEVLGSGQLAQGRKVKEFEEAFAAWCGVKYAIATSSGTAALHVALLAHEVGADDEVMTTPFSFIASANCALYVGARPTFADIELGTFTLDVDDVRQRITNRTKAIIPVHLYGQMCEMNAFAEMAERYGLILVEDACQAHGAALNGKGVGAFGTACYSFYPTKNMTTSEGGMITTNDARIADRARLIREHGSSKRYVHDCLGFNFRMTDISAALGLVQLKKVNGWNEQRRRHAAYLSERLSRVEGVIPPFVREGATHVFHQYTIRVKDRELITKKLMDHGIGFGVYYPTPIHQQPLYRKMGFRDYLPNAELASAEVVSLPIHPSLSQDDLNSIVEAVRA